MDTIFGSLTYSETDTLRRDQVGPHGDLTLRLMDIVIWYHVDTVIPHLDTNELELGHPDLMTKTLNSSSIQRQNNMLNKQLIDLDTCHVDMALFSTSRLMDVY
jgi:hypothetical protein